MLELLKSIFKKSTPVDFMQLVENGALIIDVRTTGEFSQGHLKNSKNIPLNQLLNNLDKLSKDKPIITCCASGIRSGNARTILKSQGYLEVYNGGGWKSLEGKLTK